MNHAETKGKCGKVYLVGAGPGDPGLLTLRGLELLRRADLVVYDGLVNPHLLHYTSAETERTARTTQDGVRLLDQGQINQRLIEEARKGKQVVRLKGGDPLVFGRGAEEATALREAGIDYEIVPGITAAVAAGAYAGISLTHREIASGVAFITGHEHPEKSESTLEYRELAKFPGTLVFYMGLHRLPEIAAKLVESGKAKGTSVAVICRGTWPIQRTVVGDLGTIAEKVAREKLSAPSLIIVGECVKLRESIRWFEERPLFGMRIGIPRAATQQDELLSRVYELGGEPVFMPVIEILPPASWGEVDRLLERIEAFDWIVFTSSNGVESLCARLWESGGDARRLGRAKIAAIGPGTAKALDKYGLRADVIPETYRAEGLAEVLKPLVKGKQVLWARANRGRDVLPQELRYAGGELEEVVVYRNEDVGSWSAEVVRLLEGDQIDWIALSSPSIARGVARLLAGIDGTRKLKLASISPVTTEAANEAGLSISAEAAVHTWEGVLGAIVSAGDAVRS
jgi:uroporphyrinogen III methyltransferase/synthase